MGWLLLFVLQTGADSPGEAFARAEALYRDQSYEAAIEAYEAMRSRGIEDGVLYYNLGNAYFKAGRLGRAILNYERALALLPGDEDVQANLAYARGLVAGAVEPVPLPLAIGWVVELYRGLGPDALARLLSSSFLLGGVAVTLWLVTGGTRFRRTLLATLLVTGVLALGSGGALAAKLWSQTGRVEAIVLSDNAYLRSGPGETNPRLAEIHEGLKLRVLGERDDWLQVALPNGLVGWIRRDQVETI